MSTLIDELKQGKTPDFIEDIARKEGVTKDTLVDYILKGYVAVCRNNLHTNFTPIAIGKDMKIKINANTGTSPTQCDSENEMDKIRVAIDSGADTLMDLSIAGDTAGMRRSILKNFDITLGTVPIYEAMIGLESPVELTIKHFCRTNEKKYF